MIKSRLTKRPLLLFAIITLATPLAVPRRSALAAPRAPDTTKDAAERPITWTVSGPMGGDARDLAMDTSDPHHLLMGTIDGQLYETRDGARTWSRVASFDHPGLYVDNVIIDPRDPKVIYTGLHKHTAPGGFFKSTDGGETWKESAELKTEAIHSLTQSPSNPDVLVAGSNTGVFVSKDAGDSWTQLPTSAYPDIRNVESLAVDPRDNDHIYVGTWHLPWKTTDGGKTWSSIKTGMIDDSDVFAITIDSRQPDHVVASACSGIYESRNAGALWRKVQGIPQQSRRTRDIVQHPSLPNVIYAGTTEGFWRSVNGGDSWMLTTSRQLEINSIAVHPKEPNTVYIGTNNYGVMISRDGGKNFVPSNEGYSGRRAYFILPDREKPGRVYAATINTATGGGFFFVSNDGGTSWQPSMRNMPSRLIAYSILQDRDDANTIYLGTNLGVYRSLDRGASWTPVGSPEDGTKKPAPKRPVRRSAASRRRAAAQSRAASVGDASATQGSSSASTTPRRTSRPGAGGGDSSSRPAPVGSGAGAQAEDRKMMMRAQVVLAGLGYSIGAPDGVAGTRTVAALRRFEADKDLPQTGRLDDATLNALGLGGGKQTVEEAKSVQTAPVALPDTINSLVYSYQPDGQVRLLAATNKGLYRTVAAD
ncbi:MAG: peptidoglycan-binding protein, partial [Pyrinomonadaceae bacterium]